MDVEKIKGWIIMNAKVFGLDGSVKGSVELPSVFNTPYNPRLIKRAVLAIQSAQKQPKGSNPQAGKQNTAMYMGYRGVPAHRRTINVEHARLPRMRNRRAILYGRVAQVPHAVGGHAAHPLKAWEVIVEKINKKEKRLALQSAIAATLNKDLVAKRFLFDKELPIVVDDALEKVAKTKEVVSAMEKVGVGKDLDNAKSKIRKRAGKGKSRGRIWKEKKSVLIVVENNSAVLKAARNLPGVEAVTANSLNTELLAPGTEAGRLVVWTKGAVEALGKEKVKATPKQKVTASTSTTKKEAKAGKEGKAEDKKEKKWDF